MKAYKLVRNINGKRYSVNPFLDKYGCRLQYKITEPVTPKIKGSKIFLFKNQRDAEFFLEDHLEDFKSETIRYYQNVDVKFPIYELWEVDVIREYSESVFILPVWYMNFKDVVFNYFWDSTQKSISPQEKFELDLKKKNSPKGTIGASKIKFSKLIKTFETK